MRQLLVATLLTVALSAQGGSYVVDAQQRAGALFADLPAAIAAVPDGSTLLVRSGAYANVEIVGKGLTILGEGAVTIGTPSDQGPFLAVRSTTSNQAVLVRGLRPATPRGVSIIDARGPVTVDGSGIALLLPPGNSPTLTVHGSSQVAFRQLTVEGNGAAEIADSVVVFENCVLRGSAAAFADGLHGTPGAPAVWASNSHVQLVHTPTLGGNGAASGDNLLAGSPAVLLATSSLRVLGFAVHPLAGGTDPTKGALPAVAGVGIARIAPTIAVADSMVDPGVLLTRPQMPSLTSTTCSVGGMLTATRHGAAGTLCAIAISVRGPAKAMPTLADPVWVRDTTFLIEALGRASATGVFTVQKSVPPDPVLRGYQVVWQAADLGPSGLLAVSNPSPCFVY